MCGSATPQGKTDYLKKKKKKSKETKGSQEASRCVRLRSRCGILSSFDSLFVRSLILALWDSLLCRQPVGCPHHGLLFGLAGLLLSPPLAFSVLCCLFCPPPPPPQKEHTKLTRGRGKTPPPHSARNTNTFASSCSSVRLLYKSHPPRFHLFSAFPLAAALFLLPS